MTPLMKGSKGALLEGARKKWSLIAFIIVSIDRFVKWGVPNDNCNMTNMDLVIIIIITFQRIGISSPRDGQPGLHQLSSDHHLHPFIPSSPTYISMHDM